MSVSTFMGLQTALRGLLAQQRSLDVTSHNIANANTLGYSRQEAVLSASDAYAYPSVAQQASPGQIGTGVDVDTYRRIRDAYVDIQLRAQTMLRGQGAATHDGLRQVELSFNEPSDNGIGSLLSRFFDAWQDVANAPENVATRQALVSSAASLAEGFRSLDARLSTIATQTQDGIDAALGEANSIGARIASLNNSISNQLITGGQPNDLLDQRDALLDRLYELGNVSVTAGANGLIDVTIGGATLVTGVTATTIAETDFPAGGLTSGSLAGLRTLRDVALPGYRADLDAVASSLVSQTNTLHGTGFTLSGVAGGSFFTGTSAATIGVSAAIAADPRLIAASGNGQPGNSDVSASIAALRGSVASSYAQLVTRLGAEAQETQRALGNADILVDSLTSRRESVSGVSLDEEMANLVRFQRGYQASARAMSAMDEMIDMLINRTGRVGL